jgi:hypothetical protein
MTNKTITRPSWDRLASARLGLDGYLQEMNDWLVAKDEAGRKTSAAADNVAGKLEATIECIRAEISS